MRASTLFCLSKRVFPRLRNRGFATFGRSCVFPKRDAESSAKWFPSDLRRLSQEAGPKVGRTFLSACLQVVLLARNAVPDPSGADQKCCIGEMERIYHKKYLYITILSCFWSLYYGLFVNGSHGVPDVQGILKDHATTDAWIRKTPVRNNGYNQTMTKRINLTGTTCLTRQSRAPRLSIQAAS